MIPSMLAIGYTTWIQNEKMAVKRGGWDTEAKFRFIKVTVI